MNTVGPTTGRAAIRCDERQREIRLDAQAIPPRLVVLALALEAALRARDEDHDEPCPDEEWSLRR